MKHGIPTVYRNVRFRSRLEARWASMFDKLNWIWAYEPFDLAGYIPDFLLQFPFGEVMAEVKPKIPSADFEEDIAKAWRSGWKGRYCILSPAFDQISAMSIRIGCAIEFESTHPNHESYSQSDALLVHCGNCKKYSIAISHDWPECWGCGACNLEDGDIPPNSWLPLRSVNPYFTERLWAESGNDVQWRSAT